MYNSFDTDSILFKILNKSLLKETLTGDIYFDGDRPANSNKEDIVINTITLTQDFHPQMGESNINIYVPDMIVNIEGNQQTVANRIRLKELSIIALTAIKESRLKGVKAIVKWQRTFNEPSIKQHFTNIRISWNIQTNEL